MDQDLPGPSQALAWALVAVQPEYPFRTLSVFCGTLVMACADIDAAELVALMRALQHCTPGATMYTDGAFVHDGLYVRGRDFCCSSRSAWAEVWVQ
eukprot:621050-Pyramimonas_sp.AAC.1